MKIARIKLGLRYPEILWDAACNEGEIKDSISSESIGMQILNENGTLQLWREIHQVDIEDVNKRHLSIDSEKSKALWGDLIDVYKTVIAQTIEITRLYE